MYRTELTLGHRFSQPIFLFKLDKSMKAVISNPLGARKTTGNGKWPITSDQELLIRTLREAAGRAAKQRRTVLASFTQPVEWCDTIRAFTGARCAGLGECFFWEQPAEQNTLVGVGAATTIETGGITCFIDSASAWRALMNDAVVTYAPATMSTPGSGPVLFGGFAFDPLSPRTQLWAEFPGGLLILPRVLLSYSANHVTLTINRMILQKCLISVSLSRGCARAIQPLSYLPYSAENASLWVQPPSGSSRPRMDRYTRWHWQGRHGAVKPQEKMRSLVRNFYRVRRI